jgi:hypothetical protein
VRPQGNAGTCALPSAFPWPHTWQGRSEASLGPVQPLIDLGCEASHPMVISPKGGGSMVVDSQGGGIRHSEASLLPIQPPQTQIVLGSPLGSPLAHMEIDRGVT